MKRPMTIYFKRFYKLTTSSAFWGLTIIGNLFIVLCSALFFVLEHKVNDRIVDITDAIWWAFATATTVGYGDIVPVTVAGRIFGIFMMLGGTALFAIYTALFANALLGHEFYRLGAKVEHAQHELELEDENINKTIKDLRNSIDKLQKKLEQHDQ